MIGGLSPKEKQQAKRMADHEAVAWLTLMASDEIDFEHIENQSKTESMLKAYGTGVNRLHQRVKTAKEQYGG